MPRRPRFELAGAIHHVFARGVARGRIFRDDRDYSRYVELLAAAVARQRWNCLSYCLMPNHVHLLVETAEPNLGSGIQWLHGRYGERFNRRHKRVGHVFQGRFRNEPVADDGQLVTVLGYVVVNPVEAGLSEVPSAWPWCSDAQLRRAVPPTWLAHARLLDLLVGITGSACYDELIATRLRLIDTTLK